MRKTSKDTKYICGECDAVMKTQELGVKHIQGHYEARRRARLAQDRTSPVPNEPPKQMLDAPPAPECDPRPEKVLTPTTTTTSSDMTEEVADKYCLAYISCETGSERKEFMDFSPENLIEYCPEDGD
jgi:hypothetical protein